MFKMVDRRRRAGSEGSGELGQIVLGRWKKLLQTLPSGKSFDDTIKQETSGTLPNNNDATKTKGNHVLVHNVRLHVSFQISCRISSSAL